MRLKHIKDADKIINKSNYIIENPEEYKGKWNKLFNNYNNINNDLEDRVSKLERQIKTLDTRIQKLESVSNEINDNIYMI